MKFKKLIFDLLLYSRSYYLTRTFYSGLGIILVFHKVCPNKNKKRISGNLRREATPEYLEKAIDFFKLNGYQAISLDTLHSNLQNGKIRNKFVSFTFDDGYIDNFTYAYPIFKKHNIPFAIYITTEFPDGKTILWPDLLEELLLNNNRLEIKIRGKVLEFNCKTAEEKENTFIALRTIIMSAKNTEYIQYLKEIFEPYGIDIFKNSKGGVLSWEQIKLLSLDPLVTIGAHTITHPVLSKLTYNGAKYEILESKNKIESCIKQKVAHFAYPYGTRNEINCREIDIAKKSGFNTATTAIPGNIFPAHNRYLHYLPRIAISGDREVKNIEYLNLWIDGTAPCLINRFKKIPLLKL